MSANAAWDRHLDPTGAELVTHRRAAQAHDLVVVGASAGGVEALQRLVADLPADLPACVLVVLHLPRSGGSSVLADILARASALPVRTAVDGEPLTPGIVLVAPPERHLLVADGRVALSSGPHEGGHRPAIDPLFRSAAYSHASRVIGVVLTGNLDDGSAGLVSVARYGGRAVVQDPLDADFKGMPTNALRAVPDGQTVALAGLGALITEIARTPAGEPPPVDWQLDRLSRLELLSAMGSALGPLPDDHPGIPSPYSCPDCNGVLFGVGLAEVKQFRCRIGHAYSGQTLVDKQGSAMETALWMAVRALEERQGLARQVADSAVKGGRTWSAEHFTQIAVEAERHAQLIRDLLVNEASRRQASPADQGDEPTAPRGDDPTAPRGDDPTAPQTLAQPVG